jgi:FimV-like protein
MLPPPLKRHLLCLALALSVGPLAAQTSAAAASAGAGLRTTVEQDNLWDIAGQLAPVAGVTRQQFMVAVLRRNPDAFVKGNIHRLRKGIPLVLPSQDDVRSEDRAASVTLVADHLKAMKAGTVLAPLTPRAAAAAPVPAPAASAPPVALPPVPASAPTPEPVKPEPVKPPPPAASAEVVVPVPPEPAPSAPDASASTVSIAPSSPVSLTVGGADSATRFLPWLLVLGGVAGGVILWRRRRAGFQPDAASAEFSPSLSAARTSSPRVFDISNAAAEMARSVETSQVVTQLVRTDAPPETDGAAPAMDLAVQAGFKLDIARASLEIGRPEEARALLQAVLREGSGRQQAEAAEVLARMA